MSEFMDPDELVSMIANSEAKTGVRPKYIGMSLNQFACLLHDERFRTLTGIGDKAGDEIVFIGCEIIIKKQSHVTLQEFKTIKKR